MSGIETSYGFIDLRLQNVHHFFNAQLYCIIDELLRDDIMISIDSAGTRFNWGPLRIALQQPG